MCSKLNILKKLPLDSRINFLKLYNCLIAICCSRKMAYCDIIMKGREFSPDCSIKEDLMVSSRANISALMTSSRVKCSRLMASSHAKCSRLMPSSVLSIILQMGFELYL